MPDFELTVFLQGAYRDRKLLYKLSAADTTLGLNGEPFGPVELGADPELYLDDLFRDLDDFTAEEEGALDRLESIGCRLGKRLIPPGLRTRLRELSERGGTLLVQSEEPWIPWEIIKFKWFDRKGQQRISPYLCEMFPMTRWIQGTGFTTVLPLRDLAVIAVPKNDLPEVEKERTDLLSLKKSGERSVSEVDGSWAGVSAGLASGKFDGIHFAGHGDAGGRNANNAQIDLRGGCLKPADLEGKLATLGRRSPLVFLNACRSARGGLALGGFGGWATSFLEVGAGAFVGALWEVPDSKARPFASAFYRHVLDGTPIGEAVRRTRVDLREDLGDHPAWYSYAVFAHPGAVSRAPQKSDSEPDTDVEEPGKKASKDEIQVSDSHERQGQAPEKGKKARRVSKKKSPDDVAPKEVQVSSDAESALDRKEPRVHRDGTTLLFVPSGTYTLGTNRVPGSSCPQHRVRLGSFWIAKYPVTNEQYGDFLAAHPDHSAPLFWEDQRFNQPRQPVVGVSWHDARAYCRWAGLVLPTEAQWEAAARGLRGFRFPWGDLSPRSDRCNFGNSVGRTTEIDAYPEGESPFGTMDQAGNVWEWCRDEWAMNVYQSRVDGERDPWVPGDMTQCVVRGGSWMNPAGDVEAPIREGVTASMRLNRIGFRCALSGP